MTDAQSNPTPDSSLTWLEHTDSTQQVVLDGAAQDPQTWPHGAAAATADQRSGRGRLGRTWMAPAGSALALSVLLRPTVAPAHWSWITLAAAATLTDLLREQGVPAQIKWPNDVLVEGGRKVSGILATVLPDRSGLVLGIGLNLDFGPAGPPVPTAADLTHWWADAATLDRPTLAQRLRDAVVAAVDTLQDGLAHEPEPVDGSHPAVRHIADRLATLGQQVRAEQPDGSTPTGRAVGLGAGGTLLVETGQGTAHPDDGHAPTSERAGHAQPEHGMMEESADSAPSRPAEVRRVEISAADVVHLRPR
nr:bifunctional ligase/repressor BirA [Micrococcus sp.]